LPISHKFQIVPAFSPNVFRHSLWLPPIRLPHWCQQQQLPLPINFPPSTLFPSAAIKSSLSLSPPHD
jgi:hypothetical protein